MKNHKFQNLQDSLFFYNKNLYNRRRSPERAGAAEKLPSSVVRRADSKYFRECKKKLRLSDSKLKQTLKRRVIPIVVSKAVDRKLAKYRGLYGVAKIRTIKRVLLRKVLGERIGLRHTGGIKTQAAMNIKTLAEKTAGYKPTESSGPTINMHGGMSAVMNQYKNIISTMNGKVQKTNLQRAISSMSKISAKAEYSAIYMDTQGPIQAAIRKHMLVALNS